MTATDAVKTRDAFQDRFEGFLDERHDPDWLVKARRDAFAAFVEQGFPTRRNEAWKYTNVKPIAETPFGPRPTDVDVADLVADASLGGPRVVLVNGRFDVANSQLDGLDDGVSVTSLAGNVDDLKERLTGEPGAEHVFSSINTAFFEDGVHIRVAPGKASTTPLELIVVTTAGDAPFASHPRVVVEVGEASQASLVETHIGRDGEAYLNNVVVDVRLDQGAVLDHAKVVDDGDQAFHVAMTRVDQRGRDSRYSSNALSFGGLLVRHDIYAVIGAEGAHADLDGLYVTDGDRSADCYTVIDHRKPNTTSSETYRGVLDDKSRGTFFGRIIVRPDAQKISAEQQNRNLLLSDDAVANSTPQLEIYADDVRCAHGSTIGQMDHNSLFYLRSRGLDEATARELLTIAFANEIIDRVKVDELRDRLADRLHETTEDPRIPS